MEVGSTFHPNTRTRLITSISILSVRWFGHLPGTFSNIRPATNFDGLSDMLQSGEPAKRARAIVQAVSFQPSAAFRFHH
jgi:hypothetical protein